jgi:hypothetical protein
MAAKAIVVLGPSGLPLANCVGRLNGADSPLTNSDGYALFGQSFMAGPTYLVVFANGFKTYIQPVSLNDQNQNLLVGGNSTDPENINLPPLSFNKPSRDSIINVQANFCNLFDADGWPIFEDFIDWLILNNPTKAEDWVTRLKAAGSTHITLGLSGDYNGNLGWIDRYPVPSIDWSADIGKFSVILDWVIAHDLIPFMKLNLDGFDFDPTGNGVGYNWGIKNLPTELPKLEKYFKSCLWSTGWDGCFPGWSVAQLLQMLRLLRNILGPDACIDTEFGNGYSHMGSASGDWAPDKLGILDNFSLEIMTYPPPIIGVQQLASRLLGPNAKNIDQPNVGPYYLKGLDKKTNICYFEDIGYQCIRKQATSQDAILAANYGANYGFTSFGNGQPSL